MFYHAFTNPEYVGERRAERREQQYHGLQETLLVQALVGSIWDACATTWRKLLAAPLHVQPVRAPQKFRQPCGGILRWSESPVAEHSAPLHHIISYARTMCTVRSMSPRLHTGAKTLALGYRTWLPCVHAHLSAHVKTATTCSQAYEDKYHNFSTMLMAQLGTSLVACVLLWLVSALTLQLVKHDGGSDVTVCRCSSAVGFIRQLT